MARIASVDESWLSHKEVNERTAMALSAPWGSQKTSAKAGGLILRTAQGGLCLGPLKVANLEHRELINSLAFQVLLLYVLPDLLLLSFHYRNEVSSRPEALTAPFLSRYPTTWSMEYLGGIDTSICAWSRIRCPSLIQLSRCAAAP
jgi:hypothetical protein